MSRYRSKPSEIEAVQWTGDNAMDVRDFGARVAITGGCNLQDSHLMLLAGKDGA